MYSASVVLNAVSVCNLDCHTMGHPAYLMTNPVLDFDVLESPSAVSGFHVPQKSASAKQSNEALVGSRMMPSSFVPMRYLTMQRTASACDCFGNVAKRAH